MLRKAVIHVGQRFSIFNQGLREEVKRDVKLKEYYVNVSLFLQCFYFCFKCFKIFVLNSGEDIFKAFEHHVTGCYKSIDEFIAQN